MAAPVTHSDPDRPKVRQKSGRFSLWLRLSSPTRKPCLLLLQNIAHAITHTTHCITKYPPPPIFVGFEIQFTNLVSHSPLVLRLLVPRVRGLQSFRWNVSVLLLPHFSRCLSTSLPPAAHFWRLALPSRALLLDLKFAILLPTSSNRHSETHTRSWLIPGHLPPPPFLSCRAKSSAPDFSHYLISSSPQSINSIIYIILSISEALLSPRFFISESQGFHLSQFYAVSTPPCSCCHTMLTIVLQPLP